MKELIHDHLLDFRRPQQTRQPGTAGGQGNAGQSGNRSGNKAPAQPANIPVSKSMCLT